MAGTRRRFSAEFKRGAVELARRDGVSVAQVARELEVGDGVLRRWITQFESGRWEAPPGQELKSAQTQELERLRRENVRLKAERDILKKAAAFFAKESL